MNKVNVYGSFTQALFFSGVVSIPKYLLTHYKKIGLSDGEMMVLIQILCEAESNPYPSIATLAGRMTAPAVEIEEFVGRLVEKKLLTIERYWNCLLYTSDAADEEDSVDLGGRRIIK